MEQEHGDCGSCFPHQGLDDGHGIRFDLQRDRILFHVGEGHTGEVNKISGDGLELEDQLKLIRQFFKNPQLKQLRLDCLPFPSFEFPDDSTHAMAVWMEIMRELQDSTSLEYLEFAFGIDARLVHRPQHVCRKLGDGWELPLKEMLSGISSLLGLKIKFDHTSEKCEDVVLEAISKNKTLPLLHVDFYCKLYRSSDSREGWKALMASLTPDSFGYQTNTSLRTLHVDIDTSSFRVSNDFVEALVEAFVSMLESNTTLTRVNIPHFDGSASHIIKVLKALERNQSVSSVIHDDWMRMGRPLRPTWEFSTEDVFDAILRLINFRSVHGYALTMVDVRGSDFDKPKYVNPIQDALKRKPFTNTTSSDLFVRPTLCRVFLCGFPEAGKTTLRKKLEYILHKKAKKAKKFHIPSDIWKKIKIPFKQVPTRTKGVEVVTAHSKSCELSLWDMGGQDEFHAFHDLLIPDLSNHGSASLFTLVCSMVTTKDGKVGTIAKSTKAIEYELRYWLGFLSSNTRTSRNFKVHVIMVFTHVDKLPKSMNYTSHVDNLLQSVKGTFADFFEFSSREYFVNSNEVEMVEPFVECVENEVDALLSQVPKIYKACLEMQHEITKWKGNHPQEPIIKWECFVTIFKESPTFKEAPFNNNIVQDICKILASSLNEGGYILYFEDLNVTVVDPNWFGTRIIGLIFSIDQKCVDPHTKEPITDEKGYIEREKLVSVLENSFMQGTKKVRHPVVVDDLIDVMKKLNICYEKSSHNDGDKQQSIIIPATFRDDGGLAYQGKRKLNWNAMGSPCIQSIVYVGHRLQCEDSTRTFLTHGFFPRLQVVFEKKFGSKPTFRLEKNLVAFTEDGMQVLVEHSGDLSSGKFVDGFIDIMIQSLKSPMKTLQFAKEEVMRPIRRLCALPTFGCQGVTLLESILRPKCVEELWLCSERRDQAIKKKVLVENILLKRDFEDYIHHWPDHHGDKAYTLLGEVVWIDEIVNVRMTKIAEVASDLMQDQVVATVTSKMKDIRLVEELHIPSLECLYKELKVEIGKVGDDIVERINQHTDEKIKSLHLTLHDMQRKILQEISINTNKMIDHSMQLQQRQVPRYVYVTTQDLETSEWLISSLVPGLQSVQLHLMCEHKGNIHMVDDQKGVALRLESEILRGLRPYVIWGLRIMTILLKVGANVGAGVGSMVPDLEKSLLNGVASIIPNISSHVLEAEGTSSEQVNLLKLKNYFKDSETKVAEQWLVNFLASKNLQRDFGLQRICYTYGSKEVAWVCQKHVDDGQNAKTLELYPVQASGVNLI